MNSPTKNPLQLNADGSIRVDGVIDSHGTEPGPALPFAVEHSTAIPASTPCFICGGQPDRRTVTDLDHPAFELSHCGFRANGEMEANAEANWTTSQAYLAKQLTCPTCNATGGGHAPRCVATVTPNAITRDQWLRTLDAYGHMRDENATGAIRKMVLHEITAIRIDAEGDVAGVMLEDGTAITGYERVEMMRNPETGEGVMMAQFRNPNGIAVLDAEGKPFDMVKAADEQERIRNKQAVDALKRIGVPDKVIVDMAKKRGGGLVGADGKPMRKD